MLQYFSGTGIGAAKIKSSSSKLQCTST